MVEQSDNLARETGDESGANYSAKLLKSRGGRKKKKIIQKYIGIVPNWQNLFQTNPKDTQIP